MLLFSSNTISIPNNQRRKLRLRISSFPKVTSFVAVQLLSHVWFFAIPWAECARLPCPSLFPGICSNSCALSRCCYPTIPSSPPATPAFNLSQHQGIFSLSRLFTPGGQASASVLPMNIQDWFPSGLTGLISLLSKRLSRIFSSTTIRKHHFFSTQLSLWSKSHVHTWLLEKPELWLYGSLCAKWCLCFLICCLGLS